MVKRTLESDVENAMKEVRIALIEADVALDVVKDFISEITKEAKGQEITKSNVDGPNGNKNCSR